MRQTAQLYDPLLQFSELWNDPKYAARAKLDETALPKQTSYAFESAGVYVMRSQWGPEGTYLALHCAPPALSGHDQPDNGTFELYAYGRWLMTDSGFYTYGHDKAGPGLASTDAGTPDVDAGRQGFENRRAAAAVAVLAGTGCAGGGKPVVRGARASSDGLVRGQEVLRVPGRGDRPGPRRVVRALDPGTPERVE